MADLDASGILLQLGKNPFENFQDYQYRQQKQEADLTLQNAQVNQANAQAYKDMIPTADAIKGRQQQAFNQWQQENASKFVKPDGTFDNNAFINASAAAGFGNTALDLGKTNSDISQNQSTVLKNTAATNKDLNDVIISTAGYAANQADYILQLPPEARPQAYERMKQSILARIPADPMFDGARAEAIKTLSQPYSDEHVNEIKAKNTTFTEQINAKQKQAETTATIMNANTNAGNLEVNQGKLANDTNNKAIDYGVGLTKEQNSFRSTQASTIRQITAEHGDKTKVFTNVQNILHQKDGNGNVILNKNGEPKLKEELGNQDYEFIVGAANKIMSENSAVLIQEGALTKAQADIVTRGQNEISRLGGGVKPSQEQLRSIYNAAKVIKDAEDKKAAQALYPIIKTANDLGLPANSVISDDLVSKFGFQEFNKPKEIQNPYLKAPSTRSNPLGAAVQPQNATTVDSRGFPTVSPNVQASRDSGRVNILNNELSTEQAKRQALLEKRNTEVDPIKQLAITKDIKRAEGNIDSLNKELGNKQPTANITQQASQGATLSNTTLSKIEAIAKQAGRSVDEVRAKFMSKGGK